MRDTIATASVRRRDHRLRSTLQKRTGSASRRRRHRCLEVEDGVQGLQRIHMDDRRPPMLGHCRQQQVPGIPLRRRSAGTAGKSANDTTGAVDSVTGTLVIRASATPKLVRGGPRRGLGGLALMQAMLTAGAHRCRCVIAHRGPSDGHHRRSRRQDMRLLLLSRVLHAQIWRLASAQTAQTETTAMLPNAHATDGRPHPTCGKAGNAALRPTTLAPQDHHRTGRLQRQRAGCRRHQRLHRQARHLLLRIAHVKGLMKEWELHRGSVDPESLL